MSRQRRRKKLPSKRRASRSLGRSRRVYWLTPKGGGWRCSHCGERGTVAYRPVDHKRACESCIDRLSIKARESVTWREAGRRPYAPMTVRYVDPGSLAGPLAPEAET